MGKLSRRLRALLLSLIMVFASMSVACSNDKETNVKFWTAPSYIKIYQDVDYSSDEAYSSWYNSSELNVSMFINEKEGGQVILTAKNDVEEYKVAVSDLVAADGQKITKDKIAVYNQKYVDVTFSSKAHTNSILGMVPDALLPFDKAVEYGENTVKASQNQGIYFEVDSNGVAAGLYRGDIEITVGEDVETIKFNVNVWDAKVPEENNLQSSFLLRQKELLDNEQDSTDEMYETYYEQFLDYRINITKFTQSFDEETYIRGLRKYYSNPSVSTIHFPRCEDSARTNYDFDLVKYWYKKIAELCFEDQINYYSKMYYYLAIIDEPHITKTEDKVVPIFKNFAIARHTVIKELQLNRSDYKVSDELFNSVIDGIENFTLLLTAHYRDDFIYENNKSEPENVDEAYEITWCPYMSAYDTEVSAERHRNDNLEEWWYSCNYPTNPYPTYHLDDAILSSRVFSWMAYEHNVVGNLYWRVNYSSTANDFGVREALEDPYDITNETQPTHGEGLLVYPGSPYGINGFVPSFRLVSIRDGMEEYEVLRETGEICKEIANKAGYSNFDINTTFSKLYKSLYVGTKVTCSAEDFAETRELLSSLAVLAKNGTIISDIENKPFSTLVKVFVSSGILKVDDKEVAFTEKAGGKEYVVEIKQNDAQNYLNFTLENNSQITQLKMFVGGKKQAINLSEVTFGSNSNVNEITSTKNSDGSVTVIMDSLKFQADGSRWEDESQRIYLSGDALSQDLKKSKGVTALSIEIQNPGEAFDLQIKYTGTRNPDDVLDLAERHVSADGTSVVTLEMGALSWDFGAINQLRFYLKFPNTYQENIVTIKSIILTF